ncbi:MAG: SGNH/GDSL hydrolase family protein [Clostridia bacterium]|nr:SGNH/GDSL hydrolase family protein [Clostridia bacterium]
MSERDNSQLPLERLVAPIWEGDSVFNESALPIADLSGTPCPIALLYRADEIESVRSATLESTYEPGRDYRLEGGRLVIPAGSRIPVMAYREYYLQKEDKDRSFAHSVCGHIRFGEGDFFHRRQICVSYRHSDTWPFPVPASKARLLPRTEAALTSGENTRLLIFGDSISTGVNASGAVGAPPFQLPWYDLAAEALRRRGADVTLLNTSVGGMTSDWGRDTARENGAQQRPDLCVIAFGMNDGSMRKTPRDFIANIREMMDVISRENPLCEYILVATTLANPEVGGFAGLQRDYLEPLLALEKTGVAVMDMTTMHGSLLARKPFRDMTGNNVNHPNDFLSRIYAQTLLRTLGII